MIRSILSILAGYAAMAILIMVATIVSAKLMLHAESMESMMSLKPTPAYIAVNLAYSSVFAVIGGFLTAVIARRAPLVHTGVLAAAMMVLAVVSLDQTEGTQAPRWYGITLIALGPLCALIGGYLQFLRTRP